MSYINNKGREKKKKKKKRYDQKNLTTVKRQVYLDESIGNKA